jgi:hypothetical protein
MSNKNNQPPDKKFSLEQEMKKRKTQEILRSVETKRNQTGPLPSSSTETKRAQTGPLPSSTVKRPAQTGSLSSSSSGRATQTMRPAAPTESTGSTVKLTKAQRRILIGSASAILLLVLVLVLSGLVAASPTATEVAALPEVPNVNAGSVLGKLIDVGVPISEVQEAKPPDGFADIWVKAEQKRQFTVTRGQEKGRFILLSFANADDASDASFKAAFYKGYKDWGNLHLGNMLFLVSPGTPESLRSELASHITQILLVPAVPYYPTATRTS